MYLYKAIYQYPSQEERKNEYERRFYAPSATRTSLMIRPIDQLENYELFYNISEDIFRNADKIRNNQILLSSLYDKLPTVAQDKLMLEMLVEELKDTNELEGILSSREEIVSTAKKIINNEPTDDRFHSVISSYLQLFKEALKLPQDCKDIKKIYDLITQGEIHKKNLPDGELFRLEPTYVLKKAPFGRNKIHQGVTPEKAICDHLQSLLNFINAKEYITILDIAIAHYYFGYIHPFYDGNGRTSRFISSLYLRKAFDKLTAISLSQGCLKLKSLYMEAFQITNQVTNRGEMDFFIDCFIEIMLKGQETLLNLINEKKALLDFSQQHIQQDSQLKDDPDNLKKKILFILAQAYHFSSDKGLTWDELSESIDRSKSITRRHLDFLKASGKVVVTKNRPLTYMISSNYLEQS